MALVRFDESPKLTDTILFEFQTPDADGCFLANPYKVDRVMIYFLERNFIEPHVSVYENPEVNQEKLAEYATAQSLACTSPTTENIATAQKIKQELEDSTLYTTTYFKEATPIANFGTDEFPAWLSTDLDNAILTNIEEDEDGNPQYGVFQLEWEPLGQREGQYFVCWKWTPNPAGQSLSTFSYFEILGDTTLAAAPPSHRTQENKYETLLERYTPSMFKTLISANDLTPQVLDGLNKTIAKGFTSIEDLGNQLQDLYNANAIHESMLPFLGNIFNLQLRSDDPILWRRQIKRAVPVFKKKGTLSGLEEALAQAGITLVSFKNLWQVISPYTWVEAFDVVTDGETKFVLDKVPILPIDSDNFELQIRADGDDEFTTLTQDYVTFTVSDGVATMTWVGHTLSQAIALASGDTIRVLYEVNEVPNPTYQAIEDYIRTLDLMDQRDDRDQTYPPKNWNVRVIEDDDPMFDVVVPQKHPWIDDVVFGQIRTEFPFSENIYNMEEWNGSLRDSTNPCHIDKNFVDCCSVCLSSKFNLDIEIGDLSNDRILEAGEILRENKPFHAILHKLSFSGMVEEFQIAGVEDVELLLTYRIDENVLAGDANPVFHRTLEQGNVLASTPYLASDADWGKAITRDQLADLNSAGSGTGTVKNEYIALYSSAANFQQIGLDNGIYNADPSSYTPGANQNFLEILAPHSNSGEYVVSGVVNQHFVRIDQGSPDTIPESPLDTSEFTFRLSNVLLTENSSVADDPVHHLTDDAIEFHKLDGLLTKKDVGGSYAGIAWSIDFTSPAIGEYYIEDVKPDGSILLEPGGSLAAGSYSYNVKNGAGDVVDSSITGTIVETARGKITVNNLSVDVQAQLKIGDYVIPPSGSTQYKIIGYVPDTTSSMYIDGWSSGSSTGSATYYRRLIDNGIGTTDYYGATITTPTDYESTLGVINGVNGSGYPWSPGGFLEQGSGTEDDIMGVAGTVKENLLVMIPDGATPEYFAVSEIDGTDITIVGPKKDWTLSGTSKSFTIYNAEKKSFTVPEQKTLPEDAHTFDYYDRRSGEIVINTQEVATPMMFRASMLNAAQRDQVVETVGQEESITLSIEWAEEENNE